MTRLYQLTITIKGRSRVYFDIEIGGTKEGRIALELVCIQFPYHYYFTRQHANIVPFQVQ